MKYRVGYTADSGGREALALGRLLAQVSGVDLNRMHNARKIGLFPATMLVAGNMIGAGIFMIPTIMASIGGIATLGWLVMVVGAKNKSVSLSASEPP